MGQCENNVAIRWLIYVSISQLTGLPGLSKREPSFFSEIGVANILVIKSNDNGQETQLFEYLMMKVFCNYRAYKSEILFICRAEYKLAMVTTAPTHCYMYLNHTIP